MGANTQVIITPIYPSGPAIGFALLGDSEFQQVTTSSSGGIQIVDRPRLVAAIQWIDRSPWELDLPLRLDSEVTYGQPGQNMEVWCNQLVSWMDKSVTTQQPPVLSITGPIPGIEYNWMVYNMDFTTAIRDPVAGFRVQQDVKLTLYEYNAPLQQTLNSPSPALAALTQLNNSEGANSYYQYTVRSGDTLSSIAASVLGNYALWTVLGSLNNIRDPNSIVAGQTILIPD
jgi:hypothetical protein